jgi:hypothetical protein
MTRLKQIHGVWFNFGCEGDWWWAWRCGDQCGYVNNDGTVGRTINAGGKFPSIELAEAAASTVVTEGKQVDYDRSGAGDYR